MIVLNFRDVQENPQFRMSCEFVFAVVIRLHDFLASPRLHQVDNHDYLYSRLAYE
jgi:hypothetical protein